jgi:hypothetical protein
MRSTLPTGTFRTIVLAALFAFGAISLAAAPKKPPAPPAPPPLPAINTEQVRTDALAAYNQGDFAKAIPLFLQLADRGDIEAQFNLGVMYARGQGTVRTPSKPPSGTGRPPTAVTRPHSSTWGPSTPSGTAFRRIPSKRRNGTRKRPSSGTPRVSSTTHSS